MIRWSLIALTGMSLDASACPAPPEAIVLTSDKADAPLAYAVVDAPPLSAPFALTIAICAPGAEPARDIEFDAIMPAHQHGMNFHVDVAEIGDNRFEVSNVVFHMPGIWEISVQADLDGTRITYVAEVELE